MPQLRTTVVGNGLRGDHTFGTNSRVPTTNCGRQDGLRASHVFSDTAQHGQEKGQANVYFAPVGTPFCERRAR